MPAERMGGALAAGGAREVRHRADCERYKVARNVPKPVMEPGTGVGKITPTCSRPPVMPSAIVRTCHCGILAPVALMTSAHF